MSAGVKALREDSVVAVGPVALRLIPWRYRGVLRVSVIAKATFAFATDAPMARVDPKPLLATEVRHASGRGLHGSPRYTPDLYPHVGSAELLFTGHAFPTAEASTVRIGLFEGATAVFDKSVVVRRRGAPAPLPLIYERSYGGPSFADNPAGVGAERGSEEPAISAPGGERTRAGFGPIGALWPTRRALLGGGSIPRLDGSIIELPDDFDFTYFQAAPEDQRLRPFRGDEWIVMAGVDEASPRVRMRLPGARALARVHGLEAYGVAAGQPLALVAQLLRVDGDDRTVTLTFRAAIPLQDDEALDTLVVVAGVELAGAPIAWPDPASVPARGPVAREPADDSELTAVLGGEWGKPVPLPFQGATAPASPAATSLFGATAPAPSVRSLPPSLPFRKGEAPSHVARSSGAAAPPNTSAGDTKSYDDWMSQAPAPALPFRAEEPPELGPPAAEPKAPPPPPASPAPAEPAPKAAAAKVGDPFAAPPPEAPPAPKPPPPDLRPPAFSPQIRKGIYDKFKR